MVESKCFCSDPLALSLDPTHPISECESSCSSDEGAGQVSDSMWTSLESGWISFREAVEKTTAEALEKSGGIMMSAIQTRDDDGDKNGVNGRSGNRTRHEKTRRKTLKSSAVDPISIDHEVILKELEAGWATVVEQTSVSLKHMETVGSSVMRKSQINLRIAELHAKEMSSSMAVHMKFAEKVTSNVVAKSVELSKQAQESLTKSMELSKEALAAKSIELSRQTQEALAAKSLELATQTQQVLANSQKTWLAHTCHHQQQQQELEQSIEKDEITKEREKEFEQLVHEVEAAAAAAASGRSKSR